MCATEYKPQFKYIYMEPGHKPKEVMEGNSNVNTWMLEVCDESTRGYYVFDNFAQFEAWYKVDKDK